MAYRRIVPQLAARLRPGGWALLEIGIGQAVTVPTLCAACGLAVTDVVPDLAGQPRIVIVKQAGAV
jgi:release factor glutamine methyltransferase